MKKRDPQAVPMTCQIKERERKKERRGVCDDNDDYFNFWDVTRKSNGKMRDEKEEKERREKKLTWVLTLVLAPLSSFSSLSLFSSLLSLLFFLSPFLFLSPLSTQTDRKPHTKWFEVVDRLEKGGLIL